MDGKGPGVIRVGFAQTRPTWGDVPGNLERTARLVADAPPFDVLVLPELFSTGYLFLSREESETFAEGPEGPTLAFLREMARVRGAWIAGGFAERAEASVFNASALAGPDGRVSVYRKVHLFDREKEVFTPGDRPFRARRILVRGVELGAGMMICFDWIFPESARCLAVDGADVLLHPANLVLSHCQEAMRTRCLENRVFAITANRCGEDVRDGERLAFTGASQITGPRGEVLHRAPAEGEHVSVVEIDLAAARDKRVTPRNDLFVDRRPAAYDRLGPGGG